MSTKIKTTKFGSTFKPSLEADDASRVWAASVFGDVPVKLKLCERDCNYKYKAKTRRDELGQVFRRAFHITAAPGESITIHLYRRATEADLDRARRIVSDSRAGLLANIWKKTDSSLGFKMIAWLGHDPMKYSPEVRPCDDPHCVEDWHAWETRGDEYPEQACVNDKIFTDWYRIYLQKHHGEPWEIHSFRIDDEEDFEGSAGLEILRRWANDYAYLQGEADRLNSAAEANTEVPA